MEIRQLKFKKKPFYIVCGVLWFIIGLSWAILFGVYFEVFKTELFIETAIIVFVILFFILGNYYVTLSSRAYIKIYDKKLEISRGLARRNHIIKFEDIEKVYFDIVKR